MDKTAATPIGISLLACGVATAAIGDVANFDSHIAGAGAVGAWTKADSVTAFDDFRYVASAAK
ncbi:MAG TPA: hypothetical protein VMM27_16295 [Casimicrobiaceae bacterium]|nr:hypothetical protein [Casimicrobiaceae bacterium]